MENNKSVTAVEWLGNELVKKGFPVEKYGMDLFDNAKAMEKEQMKSAYERAIKNYGMPPLENYKQDNL
jgi:hypothetical protein